MLDWQVRDRMARLMRWQELKRSSRPTGSINAAAMDDNVAGIRAKRADLPSSAGDCRETGG